MKRLISIAVMFFMLYGGTALAGYNFYPGNDTERPADIIQTSPNSFINTEAYDTNPGDIIEYSFDGKRDFVNKKALEEYYYKKIYISMPGDWAKICIRKGDIEDFLENEEEANCITMSWDTYIKLRAPYVRH